MHFALLTLILLNLYNVKSLFTYFYLFIMLNNFVIKKYSTYNLNAVYFFRKKFGTELFIISVFKQFVLRYMIQIIACIKITV